MGKPSVGVQTVRFLKQPPRNASRRRTTHLAPSLDFESANPVRLSDWKVRRWCSTLVNNW